MEARGKQDLWMKQKPDTLEALREQTIIQSAESSNRIEGVTIPVDRLRPVVLGKAKPRDRSEEELAGYRQALDWIFSLKHGVIIKPSVIQKLHEFSQGGFSGDAGEWKKRDNEIIEILPNGERRIRFVPTSAKNTPGEMAALCRNYLDACDNQQIPPLLIIATFVFDFLCVHPFRDGNGRVSRLITTLLLESHGFQVVKYVSLERLIEDTKENYYRILAKCSSGWHEGENDILPWINYFFSTLRFAYQRFEQQVEVTSDLPAKSDLVRKTIINQVEPFTLREIASQHPSVSIQLIKKVLMELKSQGKVHLTGRGRGALWEVISSP